MSAAQTSTAGRTVTYPTEIFVGGSYSTAEEYRENFGITKDQYRDMVFELALYHQYEAPNGDLILDPLWSGNAAALAATKTGGA